MQQYSEELKEAIITKALLTNNIREVSKASKIPYQTVYNWVVRKNNGTKEDSMSDTSPQRPQNWSAEAKLQAVIDTANLSEEELGAYCRSKGLRQHNIAEWKNLLIEGIKPSSNKASRNEMQKLQSEVKQLQREVTRKDKALAEASALLILKKKADLLWGEIAED